MLGIVLLGQFFDMSAHGSDVSLQCFCLFVFVGSIIILFKCFERNLGVDDDVSLVGKVENDIGNQLFTSLVVSGHFTLGIAQGGLFLKLQTFLESHTFE